MQLSTIQVLTHFLSGMGRRIGTVKVTQLVDGDKDSLIVQKNEREIIIIKMLLLLLMMMLMIVECTKQVMHNVIARHLLKNAQTY